MKNHSILNRFLCTLLAGLVSLQTMSAASGAAGHVQNDPQATPPADTLKVEILDGEGALNNIKLRTAREPIVQVTDENHKPVAGAAVLFALPNDGPGGTFLDGSRTITVTTDENGRAVARGLRPNSHTGQFEIRVTANFQGQIGHALVHQTNALAVGSAVGTTAAGLSIKWLIIGLVAAGATAGGVYAATTAGGGHTTPPAAATSVGISAGTSTVGAPH